MSGAEVPKLRDLSLEVFYKELVCKANSPDKVEFARSCIDQQLVGKMKKIIREKFLSRMNELFSEKMQEDDQMTGQVPVPSVVLDCILDDGCLDLRLIIPFPSYKSFSTLLSVISHRCPKLESLCISSFFGAEGSQTVTLPEPVTLRPHTSLAHLTELHLHNKPQSHDEHCDTIKAPLYAVDESHRSILSVVGKFCPALFYLKVENFCLRKIDVVKLIVRGELVDNLCGDSWDDAILAGLRVPVEFLNPLCFTLKQWAVRSGCLSSACQCYASQGSSPEPGMAFALRHLTMLEKLDLKEEICCSAQVVKQLYKAPNIAFVQAAFVQTCREAALRAGIECSSSTLLPPEFLSLTTLDYHFSIADEVTFKAIGALCPQLKEVHLSSPDPEIDLVDRRFPRNIARQKLEAALKDWPIVKLVLSNISFGFVIALLDCVSAQLETLDAFNCDHLDLWTGSLADCSQLKCLKVQGSSMWNFNTPGSFNSLNFLPNLQKLEVNHCLETWAPVFEGRRDTLKELCINCCHMSENEWSQVPELWPQLVKFQVGRCTGLSMAMLAEIVPRMSHLEKIGLPKSMMENEPELVEKIKKELSKKKTKPEKENDEEDEEPVIFPYSSDDGEEPRPCLFRF